MISAAFLRMEALVQVQESLAEHRELGREPEADVARYPPDLEHSLAHLHVPQLGVLVSPHKIGDSARELRLVEVGPDLAQLQREADRVLALALADGEEELQEGLLQAGSDSPDHPQVEQSDLPGIGHEHVARMRIGVEEPVHQDLLEVRAKELLGERGTVQLEESHGAEGRDLRPRDVFHGEHA